MTRRLALTVGTLLCLACTPLAQAEDGYELWLRYRPLDAERRETVAGVAAGIVAPTHASAPMQAAVAELQTGIAGLTARPVPVTRTVTDGSLVLGTPRTSPLIARLDLPLTRLALPDAPLWREGYLIRTAEVDGRRVTVIAANEDIGVLYGAFAWLRLAQTGADLAELDVVSAPRIGLRLLNHWDNLDGSVERGYAGASIWDWWRLPDYLDPRYTDYTRANASIGINGAVLNNVNAQPEILTAPYLEKVAALAGVLRPYGIRVYLSVRFSSPIDVGGLATADPLDAGVRASCRSTAASRKTSSSRSRTARSISSRASRSIRCSAPCRARRSRSSCKSRRSILASRRISPTSACSTRRCSTSTRISRAQAKARPSRRSSTAACSATVERASRAWRTSARRATGPARRSRRRTGTRSAGSPGTPSSRRARSPTSGCA